MQNVFQVEVTKEAIRLQGDDLVEYLDRYFVAPEMGLLPPEYWTDAGWKGFEMKLKVKHECVCVLSWNAPECPCCT